MLKTLLVNIEELEFTPAQQHIKTFTKALVSEKESPNVKTLLIKVLPGGEIVPHVHQQQVEVFYILKGKGELLFNGERREVMEGSCIYAPATVEHGLKNSGEEDLYLLANFHNHMV